MARGKMKISDIKANPNNPRIYEVKWYEWIYYASESGDIYSKNWKWNKWLNILKKWIDWSGYQIVTLCKDKKRTTKSVHRLVITAILWESELYVNHKNWIKTDNRLENLEWCTQSENCLHWFRVNWRKLSKHHIDTAIKNFWLKYCRKVQQFTRDGLFVAEFESTHHAQKITGIANQLISQCARWETKHSHWFVWTYV